MGLRYNFTVSSHLRLARLNFQRNDLKMVSPTKNCDVHVIFQLVMLVFGGSNLNVL